MNESADTGKPVIQDKAANLMYRSGIEIFRILQAIRNEKIPLYTDIGEDMFLVTQILHVDADAACFQVAYGEDKLTNNAVFDHAALVFNANFHAAQLVFKASAPADTLFNGQPAIRFDFPRVLYEYHRREHKRIRIPSDISLRCVAEANSALPFEARVVDISHDGVGFLSYDLGITLPPGTVLRNCRIILPSGDAVVVDLVVHHSAAMTRKDGSLAIRTGVRFIQRPSEIKELINMFIRDIDA